LFRLFAKRVLDLAIHLGYQEDFRSKSIPRRMAHAHFAQTGVVVPTVVHERDSGIDYGANRLDSLFGILLLAKIATKSGGDHRPEKASALQ
jgi:hypothetical protein